MSASEPAYPATHHGSPLVVRGAAGSGKSTFLLQRLRWLAARGTPVERIALVAPTYERAAILSRRLEQEFPAVPAEPAMTACGLAATLLRRAGRHPDPQSEPIGRAERLVMLLERVERLELAHHDFGGNLGRMLGACIARIDRLKGELIDARRYRQWATAQPERPAELEFAGIFAAHESFLRELGAWDENDLVSSALKLLAAEPMREHGFEHVLVDDGQEYGLGAATLLRRAGGRNLALAGDPFAAVIRFRGAGEQRMRSFETDGAEVVRLTGCERCPEAVMRAALAVVRAPGARSRDAAGGSASAVAAGLRDGAAVAFWRCSSERAQAQRVAAEVEELVSDHGVAAEQIAVIVPNLRTDGSTIAAALDERAVPFTVVGEAVYYERAEIRDLLAWMRLLADPSDAEAVVRALARPPVELRSVDIARCTQIARRRKLDMVAALAAATESPQVPPEARERIYVFLKLYRACLAHVDTMRPDLYVHRLIARLGLRRQQLFAAQADAVERLRALARFGELAAAYARRHPQATAREFARTIAAVAEYGSDLPEHAEAGAAATGVQVIALQCAGGVEAEHVYVIGLDSRLRDAQWLRPEPVDDALLHEPLPADDEASRSAQMRARIYTAVSRARTRAVLAYAGTTPLEAVEDARAASGAGWAQHEEALFAPGETLQAAFRALREELLEGTVRTGARLAELRLDTDLDVSHAVVRYLELLKVSALIARRDDQSLAEALNDINARIGQAATASQLEILQSSPLDDDLLDAERDIRRRVRLRASREQPSLERFLPLRGDGVLLSASDIDTYRSCPLKYKFVRIFRIPREPTIHQRFGIVMHQVLERFHAGAVGPSAASGAGRHDRGNGSCEQLLALLDQSWRRSGFGDGDEQQRQLYAKAVAALKRYHERAQLEDAEPVWFERQFSFKLGPHLVRGRVDRVDRLPSGDYELIDYKTGRPRSAEQLSDDVQLSIYAVGAQAAWGLQTARGAYYYLLDDVKAAVAGDAGRHTWITNVASEVGERIKAQEFEPTPSSAACGICEHRLICPAVER